MDIYQEKTRMDIYQTGEDKDGYLPGGEDKDRYIPGGEDKDGYLPVGENKDGYLPGGKGKDGYLPGGEGKDVYLLSTWLTLKFVQPIYTIFLSITNPVLRNTAP